jgi:hypothetical protein
VALIRTDVSEDRIASIFRVHECEQVTEQSCKLLYRHRLVGATRCHPPEDDNHHSHRRGNLKSYITIESLRLCHSDKFRDCIIFSLQYNKEELMLKLLEEV